MRIMAVCLGLLLTACSSKMTDFTILSTNNVDLRQAENLKTLPNKVEGRDSEFTFLLLPLGSRNIEAAIKDALDKTPGAVALVDGEIRKTRTWFPVPWLLYDKASYVVIGKPVVDTTQLDAIKVSD